MKERSIAQFICSGSLSGELFLSSQYFNEINLIRYHDSRQVLLLQGRLTLRPKF